MCFGDKLRDLADPPFDDRATVPMRLMDTGRPRSASGQAGSKMGG
jgi:hypothetical protein